VQDVGIGELGGQGASGDIAGQRRQGATQYVGCEIVLGEVSVDRVTRLRVRGAQLPEQPVAGADHLGEQVFLGVEMGIERAARQARRQHDVVDAGSGIAAQPEQTAGMLEYFGSDSGRVGGAWRHDMSINISYVDQHDRVPKRHLSLTYRSEGS